MGATPLALGKTLVNAIPVGLVGNDENAAVGPCGGRKESSANQKSGKSPKRGGNLHNVPEGDGRGGLCHEECRRFHDKLGRLWGAALMLEFACSILTGMNGFLAICGICRKITG